MFSTIPGICCQHLGQQRIHISRFGLEHTTGIFTTYKNNSVTLEGMVNNSVKLLSFLEIICNSKRKLLILSFEEEKLNNKVYLIFHFKLATQIYGLNIPDGKSRLHAPFMFCIFNYLFIVNGVFVCVFVYLNISAKASRLSPQHVLVVNWPT